jgi:hypothetical protein
MRTTVWTAVLTGVALLVAGSVSAETFPAFKTVCLDTNGERAAALAAMDKAGGWTAVDTSKTSMPPGVKLTDYVARTRTIDGEVQSIIVGSGTTVTGAGSVQIEMCMMTGKLGPDALASTKAWVGAAPMMTMAIPANGVNANMSIFIFKQGADGGRTPIDLAAFSGGGLKEPVTMVMTMETSGNTAMLAHMNMKP